MRCPKCGYISFDHNQICPKCNKDISDEQAKLNLPTYKSNPPSLLGMLVGEGDDSNVGFTLDSEAALRDAGVGLDFEETSSMLDSDDLDFGDDDQDLEISLNDDTGEFKLPEVGSDEQSGDDSVVDLGGEDEDLSLGMDEASFEDSDDTADDLDLDLGGVSMEDEDGDTSDSLDGISPNDSIVLDDMSESSTEAFEDTMEIGTVSGKGKGKLDKEGKSTVELNVSDLKINETGELEINSIPDEIFSPDKLPEEDEINIDESDIDSADDLEEDTPIDKKADGKNTTGALELSDLTMDDSELSIDEVGGSDTAEIPVPKDASKSEEGLDLGDLALDGNETGELRSSDLEVNISDEPSSIETEKTLGLDDDITIDLENLDLDLDLDDTKD